MDNKLYNMIFKRKSFHLFRNIGNEKISDEELKDIENNLVAKYIIKKLGKKS